MTASCYTCTTVPLLNYAYSSVLIGGHKLLDASAVREQCPSVTSVKKPVEEKMKHCLAGNVTVGIQVPGDVTSATNLRSLFMLAGPKWEQSLRTKMDHVKLGMASTALWIWTPLSLRLCLVLMTRLPPSMSGSCTYVMHASHSCHHRHS